VAAPPRHRNLTALVVKMIHAHRFVVLPKRWVVERTFAWLGNFRRLSKDYEVKTAHSEAMIYLAASSLRLRRLAKT
jgi:putative transposase